MSTDRRGILVAGTLLVDCINEIDSYPAAGELARIGAVTRAAGGCVPNVAADLKALAPGLDVFAAGLVGSDEAGRFLTETLLKRGVDVSGIRAADGPTSFTQVMSVPGGQRTFFTCAGASAAFGRADIDFDTVSARMLHLGYLLLLDRVDAGDGVAILKDASARGIETSADLVTSAAKNYEKAVLCLPYIDTLIVNEAEAAGLTGESDPFAAAKKLKRLGVRKRVIVHMPEGAVSFSDRMTAVPSLALPNGYIKGSTGAGDAFCAGALLGLYERKSDEEILSFASCAAAAALGEADAVSGVRGRAAVLALEKRFGRREPCWPR